LTFAAKIFIDTVCPETKSGEVSKKFPVRVALIETLDEKEQVCKENELTDEKPTTEEIVALRED